METKYKPRGSKMEEKNDFLNANAPSQAYLQGTQSQHTKANLAKEPALFQRFRDTPYFVGHRLSIQITKTKGEHIITKLSLCAKHKQ